MIKTAKRLFFQTFSAVDAQLKFPNLKKGGVGVQIGFDMTSAITSDLFEMHRKTKTSGKVIGIDPDPNNHLIAKSIIKQKQLSIHPVHKATYSEQGETVLHTAKKASWNQIDNVPLSNAHLFKGETYNIAMDTVDNILLNEVKVNPEKIQHINITNNGAEYNTLLGMKELFEQSKNLSLSIVSGRWYSATGTINGKPDYEVIIPFLEDLGFVCKFKRIHQLFWWGFVTKLLINRQWVFGKQNYGVIFAVKGEHKIPWYQSYS